MLYNNSQHDLKPQTAPPLAGLGDRLFTGFSHHVGTIFCLEIGAIMHLSDSVTTLPGIGSIMAAKLAKLDILTVFDLLYHIPFRYQDRTLVSQAAHVQVGETLTVTGTIGKIQNVFTRSGKRMQTTTITDDSGSLPVVWFNQMYLIRALTPGTRVSLYGKVAFFNRKPALISPEYEILNTQHSTLNTNRLVPIYPETAGLSSKWLRSKISNLLANLPDISPLHATALNHIHFPETLDQVENARKDLAFDELFLLQLKSQLNRQAWEKTVLAHPFALNKTKVQTFIDSLPFTLTHSQSQAVRDILTDLADVKPMNRLLEGDVGSGKTVVAAIAAYVAYLNDFQTLLLAPTQILATQHYQTLLSLFKSFKIKISLVTSNSKLSTQNSKLSTIFVGTHALLSKQSQFDNVGLVLVDEQHRFGVTQRALAASKGTSPHILTMTATPIPRTVALTQYGDLDLSWLNELPSGRLPVKTWVVPESKRAAAYSWINSQLSTNSQLFVVCPFIEESETLATVKSAKAEYIKLEKIFSQRKLGLLHGKLKAKNKEQVLAKFRTGEYTILVSTPIVEVGLDIATADVMIIEGAERFGLAQLHQLRGRVGRSDRQSYCLLFADHSTPRLQAMEKYHQGRKLAEIDFQLRGPGEIYGTSQHGSPQFKIATYQDQGLIASSASAAQSLLPKLKHYPLLLDLVKKDKIKLIQPN